MSQATQLPPITRDIDLTPDQRSQTRKSVAGSAVGNAIEWFDYGVYGYLVVYIAPLFFDFGGDPDSAWPRILALATFAISFLVRPLGGIILGPLGDRVGRRAVLMFTIALITLSTAAISLLPTYEMAGMWAPILLVLLRMVQGFSAGGEYAGAAVFMAEHAPDNKRGFYGSFLEFGTLVGFSAAAIVCTGLTLAVGEQAMMDGWWRLPFALTLPLGLVALWMRRHVEEPEVFTDQIALQGAPSATGALRRLLRDYPAQIFKLIGFVILINVAFYLVLTYMPSYLSVTLGHGAVESTFSLVIIQLVMVAVIVPFGALSDRIGRKPLLIAASLGFIFLSVPAVMLIQIDSIWTQLAGIGMLGLFLVMIISNISATLPALFPTAVRYSGFAIGYNISTALFGGTAGAMNEYLIEVTGNVLVPGWYLVGAGIIGLISVLTFKETAGRSLRGNVIPGEDDAERRAAGEVLIGGKRS